MPEIDNRTGSLLHDFRPKQGYNMEWLRNKYDRTVTVGRLIFALVYEFGVGFGVY